ncbi:MAG: glycosyl hydrolase family 2 [Bacteroidales bacterium]|nr:glycosyl hydrolase family 2 [Bacteroidales bacterium]
MHQPTSSYGEKKSKGQRASFPGTRWWWLGSAVDEENLRWNLREYASRGIGAVEITPIYGVKGNHVNNIPFLSERWMEMLRVCMDEGRKVGIQVDMNCGTGWPFGGPEVPLSEAACKLVIVDSVVTADVADTIRLQPPVRERAYSQLAVQRTFPTGRVGLRRVIALFSSRTLQKVKRAAPGGKGWVIDHFDSTAVAHYLMRFDKAFADTRTPWPHTFFNDSYEVYGADWTPRLLEEFSLRRGYRLEDRLPEFVDGVPEVVADYRETLSDLLLKHFTQQWAAWAHSHGVQVRNQAHGSPANLIDLYAAVDIPEIEGFGLTDFGIKGLRTDPGQTRPNYSDLSMLKYASSAAHITGKPLTSAETFTWLTEHFRTSLSQMKPDLDLMFCAGVNCIYFHGTCYSPQDDAWPGWRFYASVDMSPNNTIWRDVPFFTAYVERCQRLLQWGIPDNDFLVYLPVHDMWRHDTGHRLMQFDIHSMSKRAPEFIHTILSLDSLGFDCDYISDRFLLSTQVVGKQLQTAAGMHYKGLVIPGNCLMPETVEAQIAQFEAAGVPVIREVKAETLAMAAVPENLKVGCGLNMIRRRNGTGYHYFIANLTPYDVDSLVHLAVPMEEARWFDPLTNTWEQAEQTAQGLHVMLRSGQSLFLQTFDEKPTTTPSHPVTDEPLIVSSRPKLSVSSEGNASHSTIVVDLTHQRWNLTFHEECTPIIDKVYSLPSLLSWEKLDAQTSVLMGTGSYSTSFKLSARQVKDHHRWLIDLGDVRESARVFVNDSCIGCAWSVPYVLEIPAALLQHGRNSLRIEVTNLPANRIAELDRQGVPWRKFEEINVVDIHYRPSKYDQWESVPSGLNGKVLIVGKQVLN